MCVSVNPWRTSECLWLFCPPAAARIGSCKTYWRCLWLLDYFNQLGAYVMDKAELETATMDDARERRYAGAC